MKRTFIFEVLSKRWVQFLANNFWPWFKPFEVYCLITPTHLMEKELF